MSEAAEQGEKPRTRSMHGMVEKKGRKCQISEPFN
jgi:hypothetical protein